MKTHILALIIGSMTAFPALANEEQSAKEPKGAKETPAKTTAAPCVMQENVNIALTFNTRAKSYTEAKTKYEEKIQQIDDFAKQQNIKKFSLQSMSYNINVQPGSYDDSAAQPSYQLNGSASYQLDSSDVAFKLGEFLAQQKIQANVNVNKYKTGLCNND